MRLTPPMICGALLATMVGAGTGHFWSVRELIGNFPASPAIQLLPQAPAYIPEIRTDTPPAPSHAAVPSAGNAQKEFFEGLLAEVRALRNENRNLVDQVAETNRDMMKMQFRLDTHSESFRPLPTSEDRTRGDISSSLSDDFPGVLPPRASPVYPLEE